MARYPYSELSRAIGAYKNCEQSGIEHIQENLLPSDSGIDCGTTVDLDRCSWQEARERAILWCENNRRLLKVREH